MKKICAIHDLTGFGRCGLSIAIPIISGMKHQICPLPTSILSTHPMFPNYFIEDLTSSMTDYINHWNELNIPFDAIYSGYLANENQIDIIYEFIKTSKKNHNSYVIIDPVMGDHGKPYKLTTETFVSKIKKLVQEADIICPNITEANFLLDKEIKNQYTITELEELCQNLHNKYNTDVIITGATISSEFSVNSLYTNGNFTFDKYTPFDKSYPGTGDVFASILTGYIMNDIELSDSFIETGKICYEIIQDTYNKKTPIREGVMFEKFISDL